MAFDIEMKSVRQHDHRVDKAREIVKRPLTLTEKILYNHLWDGMPTEALREADYRFVPDRVACQDATAQMALLQFMQENLKWQFLQQCIAITDPGQSECSHRFAEPKHKAMKV
jgi:aconitase A